MIALFGNLSMLEIALIAALSVMIFGRNLPRVAAQVYTQFQKARKALQTVWRESGIGEEIRQVQREMDRTAETLRAASPHAIARDTMRDVESSVRDKVDNALNNPPLGLPEEGEVAPFDLTSDPDSAPAEDATEEQPAEQSADEAFMDDDAESDEEDGAQEPPAEASRRPPWYPSTTDDPFQSNAD